MQEIRAIQHRETRNGCELFFLDSGDVAISEGDDVPPEASLVLYVRATPAGPGPVPDICIRGTVRPVADSAIAVPDPLVEPLGPPCPCAPREWTIERDAAPPITVEWLRQAATSGRPWEICVVQASVPLRMYMWCPSQNKGVSIGEEPSPGGTREACLYRRLCALSGYYGVLMSGALCVGVWNQVAGVWVGPPYDVRIASYVGLGFASTWWSPTDQPLLPTLDDLRSLCPLGHNLILRHASDAGRVIKRAD